MEMFVKAQTMAYVIAGTNCVELAVPIDLLISQLCVTLLSRQCPFMLGHVYLQGLYSRASRLLARPAVRLWPLGFSLFNNYFGILIIVTLEHRSFRFQAGDPAFVMDSSAYNVYAPRVWWTRFTSCVVDKIHIRQLKQQAISFVVIYFSFPGVER